jgi:uncharacterized protein
MQITPCQTEKNPESYSGPISGSLEILLLQPTPFCNIDCDYCYLTDRNNTHRMSLDIVRGAVKLVLDARLVEKHLSVVWHAGEPLVLPLNYYEEAFEAIAQMVQGKFEVSHSFQTNGTRIDDVCCEFLKQHHVRIGLSIDGPAFLHDYHRKTRQGKPTHELAMLGAKKLRQHGIPFHVIAVISDRSLDHAEAIFRFFESLGATEVGFNVEEIEGDHTSSSLSGAGALDRVASFWHRLYELYDSSGGHVRIREFQRATEAILNTRIGAPWRDVAKRNDQVLPFRIVSVDYQGRISTLSPELLGIESAHYNNFSFGRIGHDDLTAVRNSNPFIQVATKVMQGVEECSRTCEYFSVCGGGAPSNKYFENGALDSTATMYCRTSIQIPTNIVLAGLERKLVL